MIWAAMRADRRVIWRFMDEFYQIEKTTATAVAYCELLRDVFIAKATHCI